MSSRITATGAFDVKLTPMKSDDDAAAAVGRMTIEKQFHGDLEATSAGQMLAFRADVEGSAGYVAMEKVTGTLGGRAGSFVLQHNGIMKRGEYKLTVVVVPDSGTDGLAGLSGELTIKITEGKHLYELVYSLV